MSLKSTSCIDPQYFLSIFGRKNSDLPVNLTISLSCGHFWSWLGTSSEERPISNFEEGLCNRHELFGFAWTELECVLESRSRDSVWDHRRDLHTCSLSTIFWWEVPTSWLIIPSSGSQLFHDSVGYWISCMFSTNSKSDTVAIWKKWKDSQKWLTARSPVSRTRCRWRRSTAVRCKRSTGNWSLLARPSSLTSSSVKRCASLGKFYRCNIFAMARFPSCTCWSARDSNLPVGALPRWSGAE